MIFLIVWFNYLSLYLNKLQAFCQRSKVHHHGKRLYTLCIYDKLNSCVAFGIHITVEGSEVEEKIMECFSFNPYALNSISRPHFNNHLLKWIMNYYNLSFFCRSFLFVFGNGRTNEGVEKQRWKFVITTLPYFQHFILLYVLL